MCCLPLFFGLLFEKMCVSILVIKNAFFAQNLAIIFKAQTDNMYLVKIILSGQLRTTWCHKPQVAVQFLVIQHDTSMSSLGSSIESSFLGVILKYVTVAMITYVNILLKLSHLPKRDYQELYSV